MAKEAMTFDPKQAAKTAIAGWLGALVTPALLKCCNIDAGQSGMMVGALVGVAVDAAYYLLLKYFKTRA